MAFHWKFILTEQLFSNLQIICSRRKIIYSFYLFDGKTEKNEVSKGKHGKFHIASKGIYFFFCICDNRPWRFFRCRFFVLFGWTLACHFLSRVHKIFSLPRCRERKRFVVHFKTGKNPWLTLKNALFVFGSSKGDKPVWFSFAMLVWFSSAIF